MIQRAMKVDQRLELLGNETDDEGRPVLYLRQLMRFDPLVA
jgi:hypothetical protein